MNPKRLTISVVGAGSASQRETALAEDVGRLVAERGAMLVCGGLGGVMEAACRGAKSAGGTTIGILPGLDRSAANPFVDCIIATGMGHARNAIVASSADAVIAVGGRAGTLSEIAHALINGVPVVSLAGWEMDTARIPSADFRIARTPEEAVAAAFERL